MENTLSAPRNKVFLTTKEAAAYIGTTPDTLARYARTPFSEGGPPARRIGGKLLFPAEMFISWVGNIELKPFKIFHYPSRHARRSKKRKS